MARVPSLDMSPQDLRDAYAKGRAVWDKASPKKREEMIAASRAPTYNPKKLQEMGQSKGGKIKKVSGKPVGKDDGVVPVKKGEYVVRKSATKKYGTKKMSAINRGVAKISVRNKR